MSPLPRGGWARPETPLEMGRRMARNVGWVRSQWVCLVTLWSRESGWAVHKANYAGSGAYGIPQALPGSKMGPGWETEADVQIRWGLKYIKGRYGSPCEALAHSDAVNWY